MRLIVLAHLLTEHLLVRVFIDLVAEAGVLVLLGKYR